MTILVQVPRDDMISISDLMADFIPTATPAQREQLQSVVLAFGLSYDCCPPATSGGSITKKPSLHRPALQSDGLDYLWISRYQVDSLITPLDLLALDLEHDAFDGTLGAKCDRFTILGGHDFKPQVFYVREMDILEWLQPGRFPARQ